MSTDTGLELTATTPDGGGRRTSTWRSAFATPSGIAGIVLMAGVLVLAAMAVLGLTPASPGAQDVSRSLLGPSGTHWFGTDQFGRDVFSRVASGLANSMRVAVVSVVVSGLVGITLGVVAGYYQGLADRVVGVVNNVLFAFPSLLLALALAATLERSWVTVSVAIAVVYVPIFARVARGPVLSLRSADYVVAADAIGRSRLSTLVEHVLPNMAGILVVQTTLSLSWAVLTEASLSFLGFGTPPPAASLGGMVYEAQTLAVIAPWMLVFPGAALVLAVVGLNLLGDGLRSALDPQKGGPLMRVVGMISGTSHDGIDVAVVDLDVVDGALHARLEHTGLVPYDPALRRRLAAALPPAPVGMDVVCELDTAIGQAFADAACRAVSAAPGPVDLVCTHGQTMFHWVDGGHALGTLQLGQPAWIAEATGIPVVSDVRAADIAAGGHGAPLVPVLDTLLLAPYVADGRRAGALNLGGISNVTVCAPNAAPVAWDIGPANALVDAVVTATSAGARAYDADGELAAAGTVLPDLLEQLLGEPYYALPAPKSSGKELFHGGYVDAALQRFGRRPDLADLVATLTELTARTVADAVARARLDVLVASGGGVRNTTLMRRLGELAGGVDILTTDDLGVPAGEKEAVAFALIGWATVHGLPGNVPSCTGASGPRVLGRVTPPGGGAWQLPQPLAHWPHGLRVLRDGAAR